MMNSLGITDTAIDALIEQLVNQGKIVEQEKRKDSEDSDVEREDLDSDDDLDWVSLFATGYCS